MPSAAMEIFQPNRSEPVSTANRTEQTIAHIWSEVLNLDQVGVDENFFELGGHSLLAVRIASRIRSSFGIQLPLSAFLQKPSVSELAKVVDATLLQPTLAETPHRLVPIQPKGNRNPLFWIPGGRAISVLAFREVSLLMGDDQPVYGLESSLPSSGEQFAPVPERAAEYARLIRSLQTRGPYHLAGFCMGGMVAFEIAQQLIAEGQQVAFLGLVQASAPGFTSSPWIRWRINSQRRLYFSKTLAQFLWMRLVPSFMTISRQSKQEILDRVSALLRGWLSTSAHLPEETQDENNSVMRQYRPKTFPGDVHVVIADECYESAGIRERLDPRQAWKHLVTGRSYVHRVPGDHYTMLLQPNAQRAAEALKNAMHGA